MTFAFAPSPIISVPVIGQPELFPVHRIYCVGRNYEEHAKEMGYTGWMIFILSELVYVSMSLLSPSLHISINMSNNSLCLGLLCRNL